MLSIIIVILEKRDKRLRDEVENIEDDVIYSDEEVGEVSDDVELASSKEVQNVELKQSLKVVSLRRRESSLSD